MVEECIDQNAGVYAHGLVRDVGGELAVVLDRAFVDERDMAPDYILSRLRLEGTGTSRTSFTEDVGDPVEMETIMLQA